jgi:uncharacterized damage-inducible protein DinB
VFLEAIVRLYDYQRDVNSHILKIAEQVTPYEFVSVQIEGQNSIRDTLLHMLEIIQINVAWWNGRLTGEKAFGLESPAVDYPDVSSLRVLWESADTEVNTFINSLESDSDLERIYERVTPSGEHRKRVLWEMMLHVINHGTQHRSEVAIMLTKLGHSPGDMEIL